jgi:hypothetical protein
VREPEGHRPTAAPGSSLVDLVAQRETERGKASFPATVFVDDVEYDENEVSVRW